MTLRALLIDDDHKLAQLLTAYLAPHDVVVQHAENGARGLDALSDGADVVLLDVMMPGMDGLAVLRRLRQRSTVPVIMLTARGDETDRVVGLELGADDYMGKPFSPRELLARMRAVLRRVQPRSVDSRVVIGDLELDPGNRSASLAGQDLRLTGLQFDLLLALGQRAGRVVSRDALWEAAGRSDTVVNDRTVDVHISALRGKLGDDARRPRRLLTVRGAGYLLARDPG